VPDEDELDPLTQLRVRLRSRVPHRKANGMRSPSVDAVLCSGSRMLAAQLAANVHRPAPRGTAAEGERHGEIQDPSIRAEVTTETAGSPAAAARVVAGTALEAPAIIDSLPDYQLCILRVRRT
jgi:hypothetical protein